jgi:GTPase Era involved in 16S rRNA processing
MKQFSHPSFAVVGHPNKGKSTIVSALALDSSVEVSQMPGTTQYHRSFPLTVDGRVLYELFDTPGFQRARALLGWLEGYKEIRADRRSEVIQKFIDTYREDKRFQDEIELLEPIMQGAGILYVVDASKPYGQEYEAEMEILRWTGQPSMAIINHIGEEDYSEEWRRALGHYFRLVRSYNPMLASPKQHISLLESMAQLNERWVEPMKEGILLFEKYQKQLLRESAEVITSLMVSTLSHIEYVTLSKEEVTDEDKREITESYKNYIRTIESKQQKRVETIWRHEVLKKEQDELSLERLDLFSEETASIFGLTRKELMIAGATSGAVAGAGVDMLLVGHTLVLGALVGGALGAAGAYFGFDELSEVKVLGSILGKKRLQVGPMENRNLPYILLGRALYHTKVVAGHSHAKREGIQLHEQQTFREQWYSERLGRKLESFHKLLRGKKSPEESKVEVYTKLIEEALEELVS